MILRGEAEKQGLAPKKKYEYKKPQMIQKKLYNPGWGPVRVGARSGLGPIWALMGPPGQVLEDYVNFP